MIDFKVPFMVKNTDAFSTKGFLDTIFSKLYKFITLFAWFFTLESFFPSHRAGTEVYVLNLCRYFKINGWDVGVLITTKEQQSDYKFEEIDIYTFNIPEEPDVRELNGLIAPRGMDSFLIRVKEFCPDVIHFHSFGRAINSFHLKAVHELGIKTVFTPHLGGQFCIKGDMRFRQTLA